MDIRKFKCSGEFDEDYCGCGELLDMTHEMEGNRREIYVECPKCKVKIHRATIVGTEKEE